MGAAVAVTVAYRRSASRRIDGVSVDSEKAMYSMYDTYVLYDVVLKDIDKMLKDVAKKVTRQTYAAPVCVAFFVVSRPQSQSLFEVCDCTCLDGGS